MAAASQEHERLLELEAAVLAEVRQFAACPLADKRANQRLSSAIQEKLAALRALARDLELLAEEADSEEEQRGVAALLSAHVAQYHAVQAELKQAVLAQRRAALQAAADERRELLAGADPAGRHRQLQSESAVLAASESITDGLKRTRQVLAEELDHTGATLASMETSHTTLAKTTDEYHGQHAQLKASKGLLGVLNWQNKSETFMLWGGLSLFMVVVAYIAAKRTGYFIPTALHPATLLSSLAGRGPASAPAPPPLSPHQQRVLQAQQAQQQRRPPPPPPPPHSNERFHTAPPPVPPQAPAAPSPLPSAPAPKAPPPVEPPRPPVPQAAPPQPTPTPTPPPAAGGQPPSGGSQPPQQPAEPGVAEGGASGPLPPQQPPTAGGEAAAAPAEAILAEDPPTQAAPAPAAPAPAVPAPDPGLPARGAAAGAAVPAGGSGTIVLDPHGRPLSVDSTEAFVQTPPEGVPQEAAAAEGGQALEQPAAGGEQAAQQPAAEQGAAGQPTGKEPGAEAATEAAPPRLEL